MAAAFLYPDGSSDGSIPRHESGCPELLSDPSSSVRASPRPPCDRALTVKSCARAMGRKAQSVRRSGAAHPRAGSAMFSWISVRPDASAAQSPRPVLPLYRDDTTPPEKRRSYARSRCRHPVQRRRCPPRPYAGNCGWPWSSAAAGAAPDNRRGHRRYPPESRRFAAVFGRQSAAQTLGHLRPQFVQTPARPARSAMGDYGDAARLAGPPDEQKMVAFALRAHMRRRRLQNAPIA